MILDRRKFLISSGVALATVAATNPIKELRHSIRGKKIIMDGEDLVIYRPLKLRGLNNCIFQNFTITAGEGFQGDCLVDFRGCSGLEFHTGHFHGTKEMAKNGFPWFSHGDKMEENTFKA